MEGNAIDAANMANMDFSNHAQSRRESHGRNLNERTETTWLILAGEISGKKIIVFLKAFRLKPSTETSTRKSDVTDVTDVTCKDWKILDCELAVAFGRK